MPASGGDADQRGARGAGEADMGEGMAGEGLPAQHQEPADRARDERDDAARREGAEDEVIGEHGR